MNETYEQAAKFLEAVFEKSGLDLEVELKESEGRCTINLDGRDAELHGFLDDEVHVLSFGDRLGKRDGGKRSLRGQNLSQP